MNLPETDKENVVKEKVFLRPPLRTGIIAACVTAFLLFFLISGGGRTAGAGSGCRSHFCCSWRGVYFPDSPDGKD
ncbi:hypothetical protein DK28_0200595 [Peptococcaceae bacterium SCADC1_2_3]|nr:hypothetical protein DK28_0200595 [Peptococcaceae bacterium SCADC1_2_3]KFI35197.1 hypothetical protein HY00_06850 [Peptococcaceae bacterium SCADC1_2_3]